MIRQDDYNLPSTPSQVIGVIQFKYYEMHSQHEKLLTTYLNGRYDKQLARQLLSSMFTYVQFVRRYKSLKDDTKLQKTFSFIEKFMRSRYVSDNKDIKPSVLFDLMGDCSDAYEKLGLNRIEL